MCHSSASYHLAKHRNENVTALIHGHRPEMLFRYYRELVCAEEAELYYGIYPKASVMLANLESEPKNLPSDGSKSES